ncbi:hypothetical protein EES46_15835 [Streptomyces sp. ADI98-10]|nr:hypothetical protein EES46_15835 [Streptomyces sp. ADI98-10]
MYSSPTTPGAAKLSPEPSTYARVLAMGPPIGAVSGQLSGSSLRAWAVTTWVSVGP